ncbi:MAG TPA: hypothetical protein HPQ04_07025 [Rhodospirillaceae bacterium]|nr:hypothetical protein [Rhodospirillaceae bacterium]
MPPDPPGAGRTPSPLTGPGNFFRLPFIDEHEPLVVEDHDLPYWKAGTADPLLTNACRLGDFVSAPFNRMLARFTGGDGPAALQVVLPSHRHLLYDRRKLASPGATYYFRDAGWPSCEVWVGGKAPKRALDKLTGSSLPPADRNAAKKKKAMIDSWPK